jgi:hypothetical protein
MTASAAPDRARRHFLGTTAMTLAAARLGLVGSSEAAEREPRHLEAIGRATAWVDSPPLSAESLRGKVVLVQFGTYTCINWLRTLPFLRAWSRTYRQGLAVVGVHTPEFGFEARVENVRREVPRLKLPFPMAIDSDRAIWRAFDNRYWPALYFIDARGRVRDRHFGEGRYERSEQVLRDLLGDAGVSSDQATAEPIAEGAFDVQADWEHLKSGELYLGLGRSAGFTSPGGAAPGQARVYAAPTRLALNEWALAGEWTIASEPITMNEAPGRIVCRFQARDVHLVMGPRQGSPVRFRVSIDGQPPGAAHGADVDAAGAGAAAEQRLYQLIRQPGLIVERTFGIEFMDPGVEAFAFTFG